MFASESSAVSSLVAAPLESALIALATRYLATAHGGHQFDHTQRVVRTARRLAGAYPQTDGVILEAACWLHDIGRGMPGPESHALRSAHMAADLLPALGLAAEQCARICTAIAAHSYSAGGAPQTLEGQLLQDADRLDALGAIGIARLFADGRARALYASTDPFAVARPPDDARYALDHFVAKLFHLPSTLHTPGARALAQARVCFMRDYLRHFADELALEPHSAPAES
jgi:uncharacterized protein